MPFNTALSGIRAANDDLRITGNNIANASTTGFKKSRAEFGDVYAASIGSDALIGSGVRITDIAQQFNQGNISFTDNVLDLAISGSGFFVTNDNGDTTYTRAGNFGLDDEGYVVNNANARLQGFIADVNGNFRSLPTDIQISASNLQPSLTSAVTTEVNVDSRELPPRTGFQITAARVAAIDAGGDISVTITNPQNVATPVTIATTAGTDTAASLATTLNNVTGISAQVVGGNVEILLDEGFSITSNPAVGGSPVLAYTASSQLQGGFDPNDSNTYSHSTATTIYDSLGNSHVLQQYFIKQPYDPSDATTRANHWQMAVLIDGRNVGAPTNPADPINTATTAFYDVFFNSNGDFNAVSTGDIDITNWTPLDANGNDIGAVSPPNTTFRLALTDSTQVSGEFEVRQSSQNGTTTGRLAGLSLDETGAIFARYTNGQNRVLARVALADFSNPQGLEPLGDTAWAQSFSSGAPVIGNPGTASLGVVQSGSLEDSNVDLSEQLVNLIIAQRNFQASAKTIETADQTTQTIINLR